MPALPDVMPLSKINPTVSQPHYDFSRQCDSLRSESWYGIYAVPL